MSSYLSAYLCTDISTYICIKLNKIRQSVTVSFFFIFRLFSEFPAKYTVILLTFFLSDAQIHIRPLFVVYRSLID